MKIYADLHIHSRYSRATSKDLNIKNLTKWGKIKGITLLGTGDFCHPEWIKELKNTLKKYSEGIYISEGGMKFILQNEISFMYSQDGKGRRVHLVVLAPSFEIVDKITEYLKKHGRVDYDGRPIFKIPTHEFVREMQKISKDIEVIPAHCWTPWFGLLGKKSGFDSLKQAFKDQTKNIHAIETGLSSDPEMNWRIKELDNIQLISNSDSHSFWPWRIGREANIFKLEKLNYSSILKAIRTGNGLEGTIEVDPSYGKYYYTGHRKCEVCLSPKQAIKHNDVCPVCEKKLTTGVLERVEELATRPKGEKPANAKPYYSLIPLSTLISEIKDKGIKTKTVWNIYNKFIKKFNNELNILLNANRKDLIKIDEEIGNAIIDNREANINVKPGYDGVYGVPLFNKEFKQKKYKKVQKNLGDF